MKTINDIEGLPKEVLKKKKVALYKAFILNDGEEMTINTSIDILSISEETALQQMVNSMSYDDAIELKGKVISFAVLTLNKVELTEKSLIDEGEIYYQNGSLSITLKDKLYEVAVNDKLLETVTISMDAKTEIKTLTEVILVKI